VTDSDDVLTLTFPEGIRVILPRSGQPVTRKLEQVGFEFNEIYLSEETGKSSEKCADMILSAVNASQPDLVVTGATIGKFSFFNNSHFLSLLDQLSCPIVIARQFTFPGVHRVKAWFLKLIRK
jgi:hypothetical protein